MNDRKPAMPSQIGSGADLALDDWLNLASIMRKRRSRLIGEDLFIDPAWAIFLALGRSENETGLSFLSLVSVTKQSDATTSRWLSLMNQRGLVEESSDHVFRLSNDARERLRLIFS